MREIKFRAWIEPENRMERGLFGLRSDGELSMQGKADGFTVTLMQITGLRDKNGREIYEGDVVQWDVNRSFSVGVVMFERGYYDLKSLDGARWVCCDWYRGEYEVLGNIYENPELCKG